MAEWSYSSSSQSSADNGSNPAQDYTHELILNKIILCLYRFQRTVLYVAMIYNYNDNKTGLQPESRPVEQSFENFRKVQKKGAKKLCPMQKDDN